MNEDGDPAVTKQILEAKRVIADPSSSSFEIFCAREVIRRLGAEVRQEDRDGAAELQMLRSTVANPNANPIDAYAARQRLAELGAAVRPAIQPKANVGLPSSQLTPEQVARYRRARGLSFLILLALLSIAVLFFYWLFRSDRTVDYYINHHEERMVKIRTCQENQDTSDRCMNAYTAARMIMMGRMPPQ